MPIEIRELVIKTTVDENASKSGAASNAGGGSSSATASVNVQEIVNRVLEILKTKSER
jgi:Family of unknown function (DUF5908)